MIKSMYTIYDSKAEYYMEPIVIENDATVLRALMETLSNPDHQFTKNPMDYSLFKIGKYSQEKGQIEPCLPKFMYNLHELLKEEPESEILNFGGSD